MLIISFKSMDKVLKVPPLFVEIFCCHPDLWNSPKSVFLLMLIVYILQLIDYKHIIIKG
jgi:hypothetical protein